VALTQRFGLTHFGGPIDGSILDDGQKFTGADRRALDRILAALEQHDHQGGERLEDPTAPPAVSLQAEGGSLPAGTTFYYRVGYVDRFGLETAASEEVAVATPSAVGLPNPPMLNAVQGGQLASGLWWYALTAVQGVNETPLGSPALITVRDWRTVRVSVSAFPVGATELKVWRQGPFDSGFTHIGHLANAGSVFEDDGSIESDPCPCDPLNQPPEINSTSATSQATVTLPAADAGSDLLARWRVYRSTQSGMFPDASLIAEVDAAITEFVDHGDGALWGRPRHVSQTLQPSHAIQGGGGGGVGPEGYLELPEVEVEPETPVEGGVLFVQDGELRFKGSAGTVTTIAEA
jgi:hypothetical protein